MNSRCVFLILTKVLEYLKRNFVIEAGGELTKPVRSDFPDNYRNTGYKSEMFQKGVTRTQYEIGRAIVIRQFPKPEPIIEFTGKGEFSA
jgi:hypothetical protein